MLRESPSPRIVNIASYAGRLAILKSKALVGKFTSPDLQLDQLEALMSTFVQEVEAGTHAQKGWPNTCYGMSKVGIIALTKILARDEANMMVNSVDPGYCATDQNTIKEIGPPSGVLSLPCCYPHNTLNSLPAFIGWMNSQSNGR